MEQPRQPETRPVTRLQEMGQLALRIFSRVTEALFVPNSASAVTSAGNATSDRRSGDRVNPTQIDVGPWVNTDHRT